MPDSGLRPQFLHDIPASDPSAVRVTVLMGGTSAEREISLMSGREVGKALRSGGFGVLDVDLLPSEVGRLAELEFDVAFIVLHGTYGEDGTLQRQLDEMGILYVGSGAEASCRTMDKVAAKEAFAAAGIDTPAWRVVPTGDAAAARDAYDALGPAVVVKPIDEGSSIGVTIAGDWDTCRKGLAEVFRTRRQALVEEEIRGRELTVGVLHTESLPVVEIVPTHAFYDYESKYFDDGTGYVVNPDIPAEADTAVRRVALEAHRVLGCRDFSRVDLILAPDGRAPVLEVNTIPGFTTHSLLPKSAAAAGIDFAGLCRYIVEIALWRGSGGTR